ncbi:N-acetylmuramoyl-L-alanine amidase [Peribacillus glennii]|uniref:N-acetylmuramoyl-L-alanine amidase n=1 Tax=Peribacillus glennii TaxID=2303991 RepID=A0A372L7F3_9BACI|nr:N-acetylmuramoyl-L-alanine amidase [Peribacillus glennii]RFU61151.1 N-acetylmuramoyl-L-alanine amidase [Peribacillus glennii]
MKKFILLLLVGMVSCSIFGTNVKRTEAAQKVVCIDPGHQSKQNSQTEPIAPGLKTKKMKTTSGTRGVATKKPEYVLNLEVSLKLRDALKKKGYKVYMTRTKHNVNISNIQRATYCNNKKANLTVRIHADGSTSRNAEGIQVLYPSAKATQKINSTSRKAAVNVLNEMIKTTKAKKSAGDGLTPRSDLTGFNWSKTPTILVELGFMTNPAEDRKMSTKSYQAKLVQGMTNGVNKYLK